MSFVNGCGLNVEQHGHLGVIDNLPHLPQRPNRKGKLKLQFQKT